VADPLRNAIWEAIEEHLIPLTLEESVFALVLVVMDMTELRDGLRTDLRDQLRREIPITERGPR
jgi:hypothetical protein